MTAELIPPPDLTFADTRRSALKQLEAFIPRASKYGRDRNHVVPGHTNVSRLSPAIRHRLLLESECAEAPRTRYAASTVEKFTQEIYWRRYWKAWLSLRPQVWTSYLEELEHWRTDHETLERALACEEGRSRIAIMNHFANELVETGYLHNHARMWFAGWWIHIERLPWQLGADFFFRHLLDGDPASNTLSWRWVAGLQTPGKTYLPRRSNLEKYLTPEVLEKHAEGLELLEKPTPQQPETVTKPAVTRPSLEDSDAPSDGPIALWLHEEDLLTEQGPLSSLKPHHIIAAGNRVGWKEHRFAPGKIEWLERAIQDGARRSEEHFGTSAEVDTRRPLAESLTQWANDHRGGQIVALRPEVGPLHDQLPDLRTKLRELDVSLRLVDRPEDLDLRPLATGGFFNFWKKFQASRE